MLVEYGGFGGSTAAPIAQKVIDAYLLAPDGADATKPTATAITDGASPGAAQGVAPTSGTPGTSDAPSPDAAPHAAT